MKPLSEELPGLLDIQIQIQAFCSIQFIWFTKVSLSVDKSEKL